MNLETFLRSLEAETAKTLTPTKASALVSEAKDHIQASIDAHLEVGATPDQAVALAIAEFGAARSAIPVGRKNERPPWLFALFAAVLLQYLCLTYTTWRGAALTTFLILFTNGLITAAAFGFIRVCYRARRPTNLSLIVAVLLVLAIPIAYVRGYGRGGFGQGFKRAFVEDPLSALGAFRSYHAWTGIVNPIRVTIQFAYDSRVTSMLFLGAPVSVDLAFGSLGALACGLRRRRRGGLSA